jgi:hypothetical protein
MSPRAAVRVTIAATDLDEYGRVNDEAMSRIRMLLWSVPARARVALDLGALRSVDPALMHALALLPCAENMLVESSDWRLAEAAWAELLTDREVA